MSEEKRVVQCIRCGHIVGWFEHTQLRFATACPECDAHEQFGPGVYVAEYEGITMTEALRRKAKKTQ